MTGKILVVAATSSEAEVIRKIPDIKQSGDDFLLRNMVISLIVTGVGSVATSWGMSKWFYANSKPSLALNIGIAGSFRREIGIGEIVTVESDCFADAGVDNNGEFQTLGEAGISDPDRFPFKNGRIIAENRYLTVADTIMNKVKAITVNTATGSEAIREKLIKKFNPDIETMEGATFFYICSGEKIPFLAIRSVSNFVEPRNKGKWNIPLALGNLTEKLTEYLLMID